MGNTATAVTMEVSSLETAPTTLLLIYTFQLRSTFSANHAFVLSRKS